MVTRCMLLFLLTSAGFLRVWPQSVSPLLSYDSYSSLGLSPATSVGAAASVRLGSSVQVACAVLFANPTVTYDRIDGTSRLPVHVSTLLASVAAGILGDPSGFELSLTGGGGAVFARTDPRTISAGALGSITLPGRSTVAGFLQAGSMAGLSVATRLTLQLTAGVRFMTSPGPWTAEYSFGGGLCVRLF